MPKGVAMGITKIEGKFGIAVRIQENVVEGDVAAVKAQVEALLRQKASSPFDVQVIGPIVALGDADDSAEQDYEQELYALVSEKVMPWGDIDGVVGAGLGFEDSEGTDGYVVRVLLRDEAARATVNLPETMGLQLGNGETVTLPVKSEVTGIPHGQSADVSLKQ